MTGAMVEDDADEGLEAFRGNLVGLFERNPIAMPRVLVGPLSQLNTAFFRVVATS